MSDTIPTIPITRGLLRNIHELKKKNDILLLLNNSRKPMQINLVDENEPDLNNKLLRDENICLKTQLEDLKSTVAQLKDTIESLKWRRLAL